MKAIVALFRPTFVEPIRFTHAHGLGYQFYRFGSRDENRSLTVHIGRRDLTWEWTR